MPFFAADDVRGTPSASSPEPKSVSGSQHDPRFVSYQFDSIRFTINGMAMNSAGNGFFKLRSKYKSMHVVQSAVPDSP